MARLAFMSAGILKEDWDHPANQGFVDRIDANVETLDKSPGFIASDFSPDLPWGEMSVPEVLDRPEFAGKHAVTLSIWQDLESVFAYTYHVSHSESLRRRHDWFIKGEWPSYAAWWVADDHIPTWQEAVKRFDQLHQQGPTSTAFNFKYPYDADGNPVIVNREVVRQKAAVLPLINWQEKSEPMADS